MARGINVLLSLVDKFSTPMTKVTGKTKDAERQFKNTQNTMNNFAKGANKRFLGLVGTLGKLGAVAGTLGGLLTIGGIISASEKWRSLAKDQVQIETKLEAVLKNVQSIQAVGGNHYKTVKKELVDYAGALQNLGVVGGDVTLAGMQQLATFQLNGEQIKMLSDGMLDLVVKEKGLNATQQDAIGIAKAIGSVASGQAGALNSLGISFSKAEQDIIKNGDAMQRTTVIMQALKRHVGGVNEAMAKTDDGKIKQARNNYDDMLTSFGKKLLPIESKLWLIFGKILPLVESKAMVIFDLIANKFDNLSPLLDKMMPKVLDGIVTIVDFAFKAFGVMGDVIGFLMDNSGTLIPVIAGLTSGFVAFNVAVQGLLLLKTIIGFMQGVSAAGSVMNFVLATNPIGLFAVAVALLVTGLVLLYNRSEKFRGVVQAIFEKLKLFAAFMSSVFTPLFTVAFTIIEKVATGVFSQIMTVVETVMLVFVNLIDFVLNVFSGKWSGAWQNIVNIFASIFNGLANLAKTPLNIIIDMVNKVISGINSIKFDVPSWVPGVGGQTFSPQVQNVPNFDTGTSFFQGGAARINEDGRGELVNLPSGSQIVPHDKSVREAKKASEINLNVIVQGNIIGDDDYANFLAAIIVQKLKLALANN